MRLFFQWAVIVLLLNTALASAETLTLHPSDGGGVFRFKDILGQTYSMAFMSAYSYAAANAQVTLDTNTALHLSGTISATGLKPNFAYQIKLIGQPTKLFGAAGDDATNERLGRLGRWWRAQPAPGNSNDADYDANKNNSNYIFQGYLLMAFFVTNEYGGANIHFIGNNSYHVLWRTDQRSRGDDDGPLLLVTLPTTADNSDYDVALPARSATLYGEYESTRALPGNLELPLGPYQCSFVLTEESFHDFSASGGDWALALHADCKFEIPTINTNPSDPPLAALDILQLRARLVLHRSGYDRASILGRLTLLEGETLMGLEVDVNVMGVARTFVLDQRGHAFNADGRLIIRRDRQNRNNATFLLNVRRGAFAIFGPAKTGAALSDSVPPATLCASIRLNLGAQIYATTIEPTLRVGKRLGKIMYTTHCCPSRAR
ncbi:MAG: hypothetical protein V1899_08130 [Planctomycetota bacterium]